MSKPKKSHLIAAGVFLAVSAAIAYVAYRTRAVPTPKRRWKKFDDPDAIPLDQTACESLQGIYSVNKGEKFFGSKAILKCSYTGEGPQRTYRLSLFFESDGLFVIAEARKLNNTVFLSGHWRKASENGTGIVWLEIQGSRNNTTIRGVYGDGDEEPTRELLIHYEETLPKKRPLQIIGHRGGARNVDFLPLSENSTDMMKMAAQLGANGVEIDVRMTKDGVPIIFHDSFLSVHTIKGKIYGGLIHNHTLEELKRIELRKGGRVPTLQECLHTILYETPLELVWLDIKKECDLRKIQKLQQQYMQRAKLIGRKLNIYIGVPDEKLLGCFKGLDDHKNILSLTELDPEVAEEINAAVWAPQYTNGAEEENVARMHKQGRLAFVWSLDKKFMLDHFLKEGGYDGVVTNTPSVVAYWYYTNKRPQVGPVPSETKERRSSIEHGDA